MTNSLIYKYYRVFDTNGTKLLLVKRPARCIGQYNKALVESLVECVSSKIMLPSVYAIFNVSLNKLSVTSHFFKEWFNLTNPVFVFFRWLNILSTFISNYSNWEVLWSFLFIILATVKHIYQHFHFGPETRIILILLTPVLQYFHEQSDKFKV